MNVSKLKGIIVEKNKTQETVAEEIGIHRSTFYRKMERGGEDFTIEQMKNMMVSIPLTMEEAKEIFFDSKGA
ncbi:XRE family transcriptional regulator [Listeria sp. SHR_NRA_18]|uniref:helix-turn-helix domain-containing protein n=1 Tax=Listeria sp. SHR_NRA_18 TaxID=2269046 RepID=UPI00051D1AEA|nr:helix-turn-helix transcriptional regulator [Listeria sp. SHR_NRA_18]KGL43753.1 phage repressor protein [Listeriaceae bacterium FSL A5-0209]RQW65834.1 XRE family transcriptional regulator [Listeria sp. SHR_NRA_18]